MLTLGIDIGTSSARAALFRHGERLVDSTSQVRYHLLTDALGRAELDPLGIERAVGRCLDRTLQHAASSARARDRILGVGISCFWHSLLGCDAQGGPLTQVLTWADSRASADAARLRRRESETVVHRLSGCMLRASFWPAKLAWLARTRPRLMKAAWRWMSPAEWLLLRWCGEARSAHGMATGTGLYDPRRCAWSPLLLQRFQVDARQLNPIDDAPLRLSRRLGARWPLLAGTPWHPAIGDGAANNLGAGAVQPGLAAMNVGTSAAVRIVQSNAATRVPLGMFLYRIDQRRLLIGGAVSNAGSLVDWCQRTLRLPSRERLEAQLARDPPTALQVLPFWLAERSPSWRDDLSGVILGLRQSTTAEELYQAITAGGYLRLRMVLERLGPVPDVRVSAWAEASSTQGPRCSASPTASDDRWS